MADCEVADAPAKFKSIYLSIFQYVLTPAVNQEFGSTSALKTSLITMESEL